MFYPIFIVFFGILSCCRTLTLELGSCNKTIATKPFFNITKYTGRWYEYEKTPFAFEVFGKCIRADYHLKSNGELSVYNFQINRLSGKVNDIVGSAKVIDSGKLQIRFHGFSVLPGNYWVLDTDYNNYAVVYSCTDFLGLFYSKVIWILTRERFPPPNVINHAREFLTANGFPLDKMIKTDQDDCEQKNGK